MMTDPASSQFVVSNHLLLTRHSIDEMFHHVFQARFIFPLRFSLLSRYFGSLLKNNGPRTCRCFTDCP
jgi:hypothetical protein